VELAPGSSVNVITAPASINASSTVPSQSLALNTSVGGYGIDMFGAQTDTDNLRLDVPANQTTTFTSIMNAEHLTLSSSGDATVVNNGTATAAPSPTEAVHMDVDMPVGKTMTYQVAAQLPAVISGQGNLVYDIKTVSMGTAKTVDVSGFTGDLTVIADKGSAYVGDVQSGEIFLENKTGATTGSFFYKGTQPVVIYNNIVSGGTFNIRKISGSLVTEIFRPDVLSSTGANPLPDELFTLATVAGYSTIDVFKLDPSMMTQAGGCGTFLSPNGVGNCRFQFNFPSTLFSMDMSGVSAEWYAVNNTIPVKINFSDSVGGADISFRGNVGTVVDNWTFNAGGKFINTHPGLGTNTLKFGGGYYAIYNVNPHYGNLTTLNDPQYRAGTNILVPSAGGHVVVVNVASADYKKTKISKATVGAITCDTATVWTNVPIYSFDTSGRLVTLAGKTGLHITYAIGGGQWEVIFVGQSLADHGGTCNLSNTDLFQ